MKLERVERDPGLNTTGMVAWMMNLKSPECPQGRQVVAISNDITYQSGAFGPREDCLFRAATELALEERLPLIYLAANRWGAGWGGGWGAVPCWLHARSVCICRGRESVCVCLCAAMFPTADLKL